MFKGVIVLGVTVLLCCLQQVQSQVDETVKERANGRDVTEAVIRRIASSSLFPEDNSFLARLAYVESRFGTAEGTYRTDYYGGIWQVEESVFRITQTNHSSLKPLHVAIKNRFGIDWLQLQWRNLRAPLHSGLAAALYFARVDEAIPDTLSGQALYWKKYYRPLGDVKKFVSDSEELRNETRCRGKMDLCIVLDSSGSIDQWNPGNYRRAKEFTAQMIESFTLDYNRIGMLIYSTDTRDIFPIRNNLTISLMARMAREAPYLSQGTRTDKGIFRAVQLFNNTPINEGVPRLLFVFTDGQSDRGSNLTGAISTIRQFNLKPVAVGIGSSINRAELEQIALGDKSSVFELTDFESLQSFLFKITSVACETPQKTSINGTYNDEVIKDEKRLYEVQLPQNGITISVKVQTGKTVGYWSRTERIPSAAVYDGKIDGTTFIPPAAKSFGGRQAGTNSSSSSVFITIQGVEAKNNYTLATTPGRSGNGSGIKSLNSINFVLTMLVIFAALLKN